MIKTAFCDFFRQSEMSTLVEWLEHLLQKGSSPFGPTIRSDREESAATYLGVFSLGAPEDVKEKIGTSAGMLLKRLSEEEEEYDPDYLTDLLFILEPCRSKEETTVETLVALMRELRGRNLQTTRGQELYPRIILALSGQLSLHPHPTSFSYLEAELLADLRTRNCENGAFEALLYTSPCKVTELIPEFFREKREANCSVSQLLLVIAMRFERNSDDLDRVRKQFVSIPNFGESLWAEFEEELSFVTAQRHF